MTTPSGTRNNDNVVQQLSDDICQGNVNTPLTSHQEGISGGGGSSGRSLWTSNNSCFTSARAGSAPTPYWPGDCNCLTCSGAGGGGTRITFSQSGQRTRLPT